MGEEIQRILAEALANEVKDPRLRDVTLIRVDLSTDLKMAKIYFSSLSDKEIALEGLLRAKGFLRHILARELTSKFVPDISFHPVDSSPWEEA